MNKNVSVWRGIISPPTHTHIWIKDDGYAYTYKNGVWEPLIKEASEQYSGLMSKSDKQILNILNKNLHWN